MFYVAGLYTFLYTVLYHFGLKQKMWQMWLAHYKVLYKQAHIPHWDMSLLI